MPSKYDDLFKSELGAVEDKVLFDCPHCEHPITKSEALHKAKGGSGKKGKAGGVISHDGNPDPENHGGALGTMADTPVRPNKGVPEISPTPGARIAQKSESALGKLPEAADQPVEEVVKSDAQKFRVMGSRYVIYAETQEDLDIADRVEKGIIDWTGPTTPIDKNTHPSRIAQ